VRGKTEVVPRLLGQPASSASSATCGARPTLEALNKVEADALTFETCSGPGDQGDQRGDQDKKVVIGVIGHHALQVERPDEIAALIREAQYVPPER
jgi:methionine synthase II (cobalamin-independent)